MYLHIGNGKIIKTEDIIGIFDLDTSTVAGETKKYIAEREKRGEVEYTDFDLPRSFILLKKKDKEEIKLSRISSVGLIQRIEYGIKNYE